VTASILIVDDDQDSANITRFRLQRAGFEVDFYAGGFGSINFARGKNYQLIILDVSMPGLGGEGLVGLIRRTSGLDRVPILFSSGKDPVELQRLTASTGANGWITKSATGPQLVEKVRRLIQNGA
jgi:DNA-binding response OmpR family regulator